MTKYQSESIISFWGGRQQCEWIVESFNDVNISDERKAQIEENYKIQNIIAALDFKDY